MTRRSHRLLVLILALAGAMFVAGTAWGAHVNLVFKERAVIDGPRIKLGRLLASITGGTPADRSRIAAVDVGPAPAPGRIKTLTRDQLNACLTYAKTGLERIQAKVPARIQVVRDSQKVRRDRLVAAFREAIMDHLPWEPDRVEIENVKAPAEIIVSSGRVEVELTRPRPSQLPGRVVLKATVSVNGNIEARFRISGLVRFYQDVVVAARSLGRHTVLKAGDLKLDQRRVTRNYAADYLRDLDEAVGRRLKSAVRAGQPLRRRVLESPPLVKRGDKVLLLAQKDGLTVTCPGVIRDQKAAKGDQVRVLNLATKREVIGRLVSANVVRVYF